jgi:hypothetical protein
MEMPLQIAVGGGNLRHYAGALLLTALLLVLLPFAVHAIVWQRGLAKGLKLCCAVHAVSVQYFVPNCAAAIALLLAHSGDGIELGIAIAVAVILAAVITVTAKRLANGDKLDVVAMHAFVDGCADLQDARKRLYSLEELAVSTLVAAITGMRRGACGGVAIGLVAVMLLHLCYLLVVKPYRAKLDTTFALLSCVLQLALCLLVAVMLHRGVDAAFDQALAVVLLLIFVMFFVQTIALAGWSVIVQWRRATLGDSADDLSAALVAPPGHQHGSSSSDATTGDSSSRGTGDEEMRVLSNPLPN